MMVIMKSLTLEELFLYSKNAEWIE